MAQANTPYFQSLHGLRGIVAFIIVIYHRRMWFGSDAIANHAYLGADFFFMLSGIVLSSSYQSRLCQGMAFGEYFKKRIIRLYPLLIMSALFAAVATYGKIHAHKIPADPHFLWNVAATALVIPNFVANEYFSMNRPLWTLFWEILISILFGAIGYRLKTRYLIIIVVVSEILAIYAQLHYHTVLIGNDPAGFAFGLARVTYSAGVGILIFRLYETRRFEWFKIGIAGPITIATTLFLMPHYQAATIYYDSFVLVVLYPLIMFALMRQEPLFPKLSRLSGALSYPLYVLHEPLLFLLSGILIITHVSQSNSGPVEGMLRIVTIIILSWLCLKYLDEPCRRWLTRLKDKNQNSSGPLGILSQSLRGKAVHPCAAIDNSLIGSDV